MALVFQKAAKPHAVPLSGIERDVAGWIELALTQAAEAADFTLPDAYTPAGRARIAEAYEYALNANPAWLAVSEGLRVVAQASGAKVVANAGGGNPLAKAITAMPGIKPGEMLASVNPATDFAIIDQNVAVWSQNHAAELVTGISDQARQGVNLFVSDAVQGHMTVDELNRAIRTQLPLNAQQQQQSKALWQSVYDAAVAKGTPSGNAAMEAFTAASNFSKTLVAGRAKIIARTELSNANNAGHMIGVQSGIADKWMAPDTVKEWSTAEDEKTCPICRPVNGEIVPVDKPFSNGLMLPPAHVSCRCSFNDLPADYMDDPQFKPRPSESELYGDTVTPELPPASWTGPQMGDWKTLKEQVAKLQPGPEWGYTPLPNDVVPPPKTAPKPGEPLKYNGVKLNANAYQLSEKWAEQGKLDGIFNFAENGKTPGIKQAAQKVIDEKHLVKPGTLKPPTPTGGGIVPEGHKPNFNPVHAPKVGPKTLPTKQYDQAMYDSWKESFKKGHTTPQSLQNIIDGAAFTDTQKLTAKKLLYDMTKETAEKKPVTITSVGQGLGNYSKPSVPKYAPKPTTTVKTPKPYETTVTHGGKRETDREWTAWAHDNMKPSKAYTKAERDAIEYYTGAGSREINALLRSGSYNPALPGRISDYKKQLDKVLDKSRTPEDIIVHSGRPARSLEKIIGRGNSPESAVGHVIVDQGYLSTSVGTKAAFGGDYHYHIEIPKGAKAAWLGKHSVYGDAEREVLLAAGQKMIITKVERAPRDSAYGWDIYMKLVD